MQHPFGQAIKIHIDRIPSLCYHGGEATGLS